MPSRRPISTIAAVRGLAGLPAEALDEAHAVVMGRRIIRERAAEAGESVREYLDRLPRRRFARLISRAAGLHYWPAVAYGPRIPAEVYAEAERIATAVRCPGEYWVPGESHGCWDAEGHYGISYWDVAWAWRAARGRRGVFRALMYGLAHGIERGFMLPAGRWSGQYWRDLYRGSEARIERVVRGALWVRSALGEYAPRGFSAQALQALGRLPWYCRWAAVHGVVGDDEAGFGRRIRLRDLDWDAVRVAQRGWRAAWHAGYLPAASWWWQTAPDVAERLAEADRYPSPAGVRVRTLRQLIRRHEVRSPEAVLAAVQLCRAYGADLAAIERRVRQYGKGRGELAVHDAGQLAWPSEPVLPGWAAWLDAHPSCWRHSALLAGIERELGGRLPSSTAEFEAAAARVVAADPEGALLEIGVEPGGISDYLRLYAEGPKDAEMIPAPRVAPEGLYTIRQLAFDDWRAPAIGLLTDCCQHLHNAAESCARASYRRADCAVWVVEKGGRIVAQAFVWRSKRRLVLDSVEALGAVRRGEAAQTIARLMIAAAQDAIGRLCIEAAYVGDTFYGVTEEVIRQAGGASRPAPRPLLGKLGYTDAETVRHIAGED